MEHILLVDIGNTSVTAGFEANGRITGVFRVPTANAQTGGIRQVLLRQHLGKRKVRGAVLCSVVPRATGAWRRAMCEVVGFPPLVVNHRLNLGIGIDYPRPETIGADRLANACGAAARYGVPVVVADFGTALTFDIVSKKGAYVGGVIAPGPRLMLEYLADRTALLPRIELNRTVRLAAVGKSTVQGMTIGARIGYRGMVRELVAYVRQHVGADSRFCATGGYAPWGVAGLGIPVDRDLTLFGLAEIFRLNT